MPRRFLPEPCFSAKTKCKTQCLPDCQSLRYKICMRPSETLSFLSLRLECRTHKLCGLNWFSQDCPSEGVQPKPKWSLRALEVLRLAGWVRSEGRAWTLSPCWVKFSLCASLGGNSLVLPNLDACVRSVAKPGLQEWGSADQLQRQPLPGRAALQRLGASL